MQHILNEIPGWIATLFVGMIGVGVGWGYLRAEVHAVKEKVDKTEGKVDAIILSRSTLELKSDCQAMREMCQGTMREKFDEIKHEIETNRELVVTRFDEIKEFMGYVKGKIEQYNGKIHE